MSFGTITSTESTFGSISGSIVGAVPGTLSGSVGVPGPIGPQGVQGIQGPPGPPGEGGAWGSIVGTLSNQTDLQTALNLKANLASPAFTGDPTAPTAALGDNDTSLATTAFVQQELASGTAVAKNLEVYVRNQTGSTLAAGSIVYINGATGNRPTVTLAQANNDANSAQTFGFVKASIANNGFGYVIVRGECEALDTSAVAEGTQLYLSPTVAGAYTTTKPSAPQHLVYVGIVVRSHPTQGVILVAVQNGYELDELHDVAIGTLANNDLLAYESSTDLWKNKSFGTLGLLTSSSLTGYATESWVTAGFAPIAAGQPTSGTVGQVLTKNSGTAYDSSWQTLIPGDRYVTSSSSSLTIGTGSKSLTIGTGLAYTPNQDVTISLSSDPTLHHMHGPVVSYNSGTGALTVDVQSITGSGTYSSWVVNVGGTVPLQTVEWGEVLGTLGDQTDLATALNAKLEVTDAASTYYLQTNPSGYITSSALTGYATESWVTSQGYETAANAAATYYPLTNPAGYLTSSALAGYATESWVTSQGYLTSAPVTSVAGRTGAITLSNTDISGLGTMATATAADYSTTTVADGLYYPLSSNPAGYLTSASLTGYATESWVTAGFYPLTGNPSSFLVAADIAGKANLSGATFTGKVNTVASTTTTAGLNIPHGVAPTSPVNGDIWTTTGNVLVRLNGGTQTLAMLGGNNVFTNASNTFGSSTGTGTIGLASGATISGSTKTLNIGTGGVAGSTTNITIGSTTGTSTTTLQGITNGVTQSAGDSSLKLATTAFVTTADNLKANIASPTFTGTPAAPTASPGTNTTQIATTAFVTAAVPAIATFSESQQLASTTKVMSPFDVLLAMMTEGYRPALGMTGGSSGTGAGVNPIMPQYMGIGGPNAGVAGSCHAITNNFGAYSTAAGSGVTIAWNKPVCLSGTFAANGASLGDANNEFKLFLGPSMLNGNDPTSAAIGLWRNGGTSAISLMVHNGTTLTKVASAGTYSGTNPIRYLIYSDGAGNVTLYINGTQVATTALGPTSAFSNTGQFTASILQNASAATKYYIELVHPKIFVAPQ